MLLCPSRFFEAYVCAVMHSSCTHSVFVHVIYYICFKNWYKLEKPEHLPFLNFLSESISHKSVRACSAHAPVNREMISCIFLSLEETYSLLCYPRYVAFHLV